MDSSCRGCGAALPPMKRPGRERIWCSAACRGRTRRREQGHWTRAEAGRRACLHCSELFTPRTAKHAFCSDRCGWLYRARRRPKSADWAAGRQPERVLPCMGCGEDTVTRGSRVCCEFCREESKRSSNRRKNVKRRGARVGIKFTVTEIGDRDGWRCVRCRRKVDSTLPGTHRRGPTIDHLVPVSAGGVDEPSNVAIAHRSCNLKARHLTDTQLRLVG